MKMFKLGSAGIMLLVLLLGVSACGGGNASPTGEIGKSSGEGGTASAVTDKPVKLLAYANFGGYTTERFMEVYGEWIQKKYPNFSFEIVEFGNGPEALIASNTKPDLILTTDPALFMLQAAKLETDLEPLIKERKFDLERFHPATLNTIRKLGDGKLVAIPVKINTEMLVYNKDLFNNFGIEYPWDGITWDETFELARELTRFVDGKQYYGFGTTSFQTSVVLNPYSLELIDPKTGKVSFNNDQWKKFITNFARFGEIPGYENSENRVALYRNIDQFRKDGDIAMAQMQNSDFPKTVGEWSFDYDFVNSPYFEDLPGLGTSPFTLNWVVSSVAAHPKEAFAAIEVMLSDEVQLDLSKQAQLSPLKNKEIRQAFGTGIETLKGKNTLALAPDRLGEASTRDQKFNIANVVLYQMFQDLINGKVDINSGLRQAEEEANIQIEALGK